MKKVFKVLVGIFIVLFALLYISGNSYVIPGLIKIYGTGHTTAFLHDYNVFDNRTVEAADLPQEWPLHQKYNTIEPTKRLLDAHDEFKSLKIENVRKWGKNNHLVYDIKYVFDVSEVDGRL